LSKSQNSQNNGHAKCTGSTVIQMLGTLGDNAIVSRLQQYQLHHYIC